MFWRTHTDLSIGNCILQYGQIVTLEKLPQKNIDRLLEVGAISPVRLPPLQNLFGKEWENRYKVLAKANIESVEDFLSSDSKDLSKLVRRKADTLELWKEELTTMIMDNSNMPKAQRG